MNLSVGIVGLPNVGKSTLFNALLKKQIAFVIRVPTFHVGARKWYITLDAKFNPLTQAKL